MNYDLLWSKVLENIKLSVSSLVYITWFENTKLYKIENNEATIIVPMEIHRKHLNEKYLKEIVDNLFNETKNTYEISFILEDEIVKNDNLSNDIVEKEEDIKENITYNHSSNLNKSYTFENFVVGNSNKLAHASALAVAESPGQTYNPLFIYGASGLGKTHLMHAIGNYIEENTNKKVLYVTSEQFTDDFVKMSQELSKNNYEYANYFKNKYRSLDVLIIDDIQFFAARQKTQEEFFHTFNILYNDKKQVIISSDRSPNDLKLLEERLKTRFCWGLTVDIYPPDLELRKNILRKKIDASKLLPEISDDVIDYIASNMTSDVRNLEGAINRLMAYSLMMGESQITLPVAVEALKDQINRGTSEKTNILKVQKAVADHYKISVDDLKGKKRSALIAGARQVAMYLSRTILNESLERIGLEFGGKDHTTVMHACEKIRDEINDNLTLKNSIEEIKKNIM